MVKGLLYLHLSFSRNHTLDLPTHTCTHTSFSYSFFSYKPDSCNWNHLHPSYPEAARVMFEKCTGVKVRRKEGKRRRGRGGFVLLVIIIYSPPLPTLPQCHHSALSALLPPYIYALIHAFFKTIAPHTNSCTHRPLWRKLQNGIGSSLL